MAKPAPGRSHRLVSRVSRLEELYFPISCADRALMNFHPLGDAAFDCSRENGRRWLVGNGPALLVLPNEVL